MESVNLCPVRHSVWRSVRKAPRKAFPGLDRLPEPLPLGLVVRRLGPPGRASPRDGDRPPWDSSHGRPAAGWGEPALAAGGSPTSVAVPHAAPTTDADGHATSLPVVETWHARRGTCGPGPGGAMARRAEGQVRGGRRTGDLSGPPVTPGGRQQSGRHPVWHPAFLPSCSPERKHRVTPVSCAPESACSPHCGAQPSLRGHHTKAPRTRSRGTCRTFHLQ